MPTIDLSGKRFGRWQVIKEGGRSQTGDILWECKCDCGNVSNVNGRTLRRGQSNSCGCLKLEKFVKRVTTHGMAKNFKGGKHPLYSKWNGMKDRCFNPNNRRFKDYGGRGITVCAKWSHSFEIFFWEMFPSWSHGLTLDRENVNGHYNKENCRWATTGEQARNTSRSRNVKFLGQSGCLWDVCQTLGLSYWVCMKRMRREGLSAQEAVEETFAKRRTTPGTAGPVELRSL